MCQLFHSVKAGHEARASDLETLQALAAPHTRAHVYPHEGRRLLLLLLLLSLTSACTSSGTLRQENRVQKLEKDVATLTAQLEALTLRTDSVSVGLERLTGRVDGLLPPSAQWLKLEKGAVLRWYIDEQVQHVYVQFMDFEPEALKLQVALMSRSSAVTRSLQMGEGLEVRLQADEQRRAFSIRLHAYHQQPDGTRYALLSFVEGTLTLP
ncbi:MAG: hypothetical protein ACKO6N_21940 [Myxococcota bacterium]